MISSWVTDRAPCRCAVPRQSAPVSPPPMMTTCLPRALIGGSGTGPGDVGPPPDTSDAATARLDWGRYSMAWCTPASDAPGTGSPRATVAPPHSTTASYSARSAAAVTSRPASTPQRNTVPSACICHSRRSRCRFSILNSGMP